MPEARKSFPQKFGKAAPRRLEKLPPEALDGFSHKLETAWKKLLSEARKNFSLKLGNASPRSLKMAKKPNSFKFKSYVLKRGNQIQKEGESEVREGKKKIKKWPKIGRKT